MQQRGVRTPPISLHPVCNIQVHAQHPIYTSVDRCNRMAVGGTPLCTGHGGGKRCINADCNNLAVVNTGLCKGHGGGKRCIHEDCNKAAAGSTKFCKAHGGGKRCMIEGCTTSARGGSGLCIRHGGEKRCRHEGCIDATVPGTELCTAHGGPKEAQEKVGLATDGVAGKDSLPYVQSVLAQNQPGPPKAIMIATNHQ